MHACPSTGHAHLAQPSAHAQPQAKHTLTMAKSSVWICLLASCSVRIDCCMSPGRRLSGSEKHCSPTCSAGAGVQVEGSEKHSRKDPRSKIGRGSTAGGVGEALLIQLHSIRGSSSSSSSSAGSLAQARNQTHEMRIQHQGVQHMHQARQEYPTLLAVALFD